MKTITIKQKELEKKMEHGYIAGTGDIAEDLGYAVGVGGYQDEIWYMEAIDEAKNYILKEYSFEDDLFAMPEKKFLEVLEKIKKDNPAYIVPDWKEFKSKKLKTSAMIALKKPEIWEIIIKDVRDLIDPYESDFAEKYFPDLIKEEIEAETSTHKEMRKEFVSGDYRGNFEGVERLTAKLLGADSVDVRDLDQVDISWNEEELKELLFDYYESRDLKLTKKYAIDQLIYGVNSFMSKRKAESEKYKAEREKTEAYQKARKAEAETERIAKLNKLIK